ncbi:MAG: amidase family protein [Pseudolabrys sp.]|jgi:aspartyl-tRNA(Asn)/glutamyl-tRNA(Gln) amidotransferase subunit A|nr:amidase family protein [Pseudolabrys sp.]
MTAISSLDSAALADAYRRKALSPVEVARDVLARIESARVYNAFLPVDADDVMAQARASERRWQAGTPRGALDGVPATIKDNVGLRGQPTLRGSRTSALVPEKDDAPAVARLREAGAVFVGKTCLPEYGWIGACHSPLTGITRNPWNPAHTPGGSTGGGAVAALLNLGTLHLGTDGAGSLRIPASFTGVFGFKPTYGLVPAHPPSPFNVLAHQGPIARTVGDAARMLSVIAAPDARDMSAWSRPGADFTAGLEFGVRGLKMAWSPRLGSAAALDPEIEAIAERASRLFVEQGAGVEPADPDLRDAGAVIRTLWHAGARAIADSVPAAQHAEMDQDFLALAERGRAIPAARYIAAYSARTALHVAMLGFHDRYDLLLSPTMPVTALEAGRVTPADGAYGDDWLNWSPFTYPFNLTQQPAASVPVGLSSKGLPIGLQIVGPRGADALVLRAARALERALPFPRLAENNT